MKAEQVESLAQEIRRVDGGHDIGAGAMAEALQPWFAAAINDAVREALEEAANGVRDLVIRFELNGQDIAERDGAEKMRSAVLAALRAKAGEPCQER